MATIIHQTKENENGLNSCVREDKKDMNGVSPLLAHQPEILVATPVWAKGTVV